MANHSGITIKVETDPTFESSEQNTLESLGRQPSIYSLAVDEIQHTLSQSGKSFGSMNMDEFLNSIWTAEENQAQGQGMSTSVFPTSNGNPNMMQNTPHDTKEWYSLTRQGSFTIPGPVCQKTIDEVWSEIHKNQNYGHEYAQNSNSSQKQDTSGKMSLEDYLVQAGVVLEPNFAMVLPQNPGFQMYPNNTHHTMEATFTTRPVMAEGSSDGVWMVPSGINMVATYQMVQGGIGGVGPGYPKGGTGQPSAGVNHSEILGNGSGGGNGRLEGLGMWSPGSLISNVNQLDSGNQFGGDGRGFQQRVIDSLLERMAERRQRKMIKNRESAARSRARKQAYTVELEAELNQLEEEKLQLQQSLAELERQRKHQRYEEEEMRADAKIRSESYRAYEKLQAKRSSSCPY